MPSTAGGKGQGAVGEPGCFPIQSRRGRVQSIKMHINTFLWVRQHKRAKEQIRKDSDC